MTNETFLEFYRKSGLSITGFCRMVGINRSTFYNYKNGKRQVHPLVGVKVAILCKANEPTLWERIKKFFKKK